MGAVVAFVAWMLTLVVMAVDFSLFGVSPSQPIVHSPILGVWLYVVHTNCLSLNVADGQKPRQQAEQRLARFLFGGHVDLSCGDGVAVPGHVCCAVHVL